MREPQKGEIYYYKKEIKMKHLEVTWFFCNRLESRIRINQ